MKIAVIFSVFLTIFFLTWSPIVAQTYQGTQYCQNCHNNTSVGGLQYSRWSQTLHSKIHLLPDTISIRPLLSFTNGDSINMGSSYGNANVYLSRSGNDYFAKVGAAGITYKIAWTYGWGFKQRYLVKIDTSYYMLPIQFNLNGYLDNSTGAWASYNPGNWFNSDGSVKAINNTFRTKSWDKNCMGCHVTGGKVEMVVAGSDTSWHSTWANNSSKENIVVGCEACHGPSQGSAGPGHQMNPSKLLTKDAKLEVCGQCHNRASSWRGMGMVGTHEFPRNETNGTYFNPADTAHRLSEFLNLMTGPNQTGGPGTWPDMTTARQHHQQYQEMLGSKHYDNPFEEITCFTCHDPHPASPSKYLIVDSLEVDSIKYEVENDNNTLCLACHATHGPFSSIPKSWVQNPATYKDSIGIVVNQHTKHNLYDPENTNNTGGGGRCSKCHLAKTAITAKAYDIHAHTFGVISPGQTLRYSSVTSPTKGMINSCAASCHRNPTGSTAAVPTFGIASDVTLTDWTEATDLALADTLWRYWQGWGFTGVREIANTVPREYNLSQNYPNPFNPTTKIRVEVPNRSEVRLTIYNIIGQHVATLMDGVYELGTYEVYWSGRDDFGFYVPSGVYLYTMEAGSYHKTFKMVLIK